LGNNKLSVVSEIDKELTATTSAACTAACTSEPENANGSGADAGQTAPIDADAADPLATLAKALLNLSPADKATLLAMMTKGAGNG
jgi:hypothetical protein